MKVPDRSHVTEHICMCMDIGRGSVSKCNKVD